MILVKLKLEINIIVSSIDGNLKRKKIHELQHVKSSLMKKKITEKFLSCTHSHNYVVVAGSNNNVGIDLEKRYHETQRTQALSEREQVLANKYSFTFVWTLKESIAKLVGCGLSRIDAVVIDKLNSKTGHAFIEDMKHLNFYYKSFSYNGFILTCVSDVPIKNIYWRFV